MAGWLEASDRRFRGGPDAFRVFLSATGETNQFDQGLLGQIAAFLRPAIGT